MILWVKNLGGVADSAVLELTDDTVGEEEAVEYTHDSVDRGDKARIGFHNQYQRTGRCRSGVYRSTTSCLKMHVAVKTSSLRC